MFLKCFGESSSSGRQYPTVIEELCTHFSLDDVRKSTNNFDDKREIGSGACGTVYKGCLQHNDGSDYAVAMKRFHVPSSKGFKTEVELLCQLHHPNCVSIVGFCNHEKENIVVYEYMSNGSLEQHLQEGQLSWKKRVEICIGAARGLHYLHAGLKRTIIHHDIHPRSILLDDNMHPKLSNFEHSIRGAHFKEKPKPVQTDFAGTVDYSPEENFLGTVTDRSDVYAFGMLLLRVVWSRRIFKPFYYGLAEPREKKCVEENIDPKIKGKIAPECWQVFIDIILRCLQNEPDERPTMGEVEVELELALLLQEQADLTNINSDYTLLSKTIIILKSEGI